MVISARHRERAHDKHCDVCMGRLHHALRFSVVPDEQLFEGRHERSASRNLTSSAVSGLIMNELFIWKKIPS